jgi:hypothetical protein
MSIAVLLKQSIPIDGVPIQPTQFSACSAPRMMKELWNQSHFLSLQCDKHDKVIVIVNQGSPAAGAL